MDSKQFKRHWDAAAILPEGWNGHLYFTSAKTGDKIRYGHAPAHGETKGTVVLTHGYGEHIDIYFETIKEYQKRGYEVFAMDWHGHGKSGRDDPKYPNIPSTRGMDRHVDDFTKFMNDIVLPSKHKDSERLIMSTNSMGGHIGLMYIKENDDVFDAAVMSTPMFDITRWGLPKFARPAISLMFCSLARVGLKNWQLPIYDRLSPEKFLKRLEKHSEMKMMDWSGENIRSYIADTIRAFHPDSVLDEPTMGWISTAFNSTKRTMNSEYLSTIKTPILIGSAGHDNLVDKDAHEKFADEIQNAELIKLPDASHGLWLENDENYQAWWDRIDEFLDEQFDKQILDKHLDYKEPEEPANQNGSSNKMQPPAA